MGKKLIGIAVIAIMLFGLFGLTACTESLADYKATKSQALQEYADAKGVENYCTDGWQAVCKAVTDGRKAIEDATTKPAVDTAFKGATDAIDDIDKKGAGMLYTLQEAYDEELLTVEDLRSIAHYQSAGEDEPDFAPIPKNPENLSNETINAIKETYLANLSVAKNQDGTLMFPNATIADINLLGYYGTYNNVVAIKISDEYSGYPGIVQEFTVAGVTFTYSGVPVAIWQA